MKPTINKLTGLTDAQLFWLRTDAGRAFALHHTGGDEDAAQLLKECSAYWDWWINHCAQIERRFIELYKDVRTQTNTLKVIYLQDLSPERIMVHPHRRVIEQALNPIWSQAWKNHRLQNAAPCPPLEGATRSGGGGKGRAAQEGGKHD